MKKNAISFSIFFLISISTFIPGVTSIPNHNLILRATYQVCFAHSTLCFLIIWLCYHHLLIVNQIWHFFMGNEMHLTHCTLQSDVFFSLFVKYSNFLFFLQLNIIKYSEISSKVICESHKKKNHDWYFSLNIQLTFLSLK